MGKKKEERRADRHAESGKQKEWFQFSGKAGQLSSV